MTRIGMMVAALAICANVAFAQAPAGTPTRIRGEVLNLKGNVLTVKARSGETLKINVDDKLLVVSVVKISMNQIKPGSFIGTTSVPQSDGSRKAIEVHVFPEAMRGTGEGDRDWDLMPNSKMTNAIIGAVVEGKAGRVLTLDYKGGTVKVTVPKTASVVGYEPADRSVIVPGAKIFVVALKAADGTLSAPRINIGKNGLTPPM